MSLSITSIKYYAPSQLQIIELSIYLQTIILQNDFTHTAFTEKVTTSNYWLLGYMTANKHCV